MMTRLWGLALVIVLPLSGGCSYLPVSFDVMTSSQTTIQKGTAVEQLVGTLGFGDFVALDLSQSQEFKSNDVQKRHVARARVQKIALRITAPQEQTFDFLKSISFFVEAPGLPKKRIAHSEVPRGARNFECQIDDLELAPYVQADTMTITTAVSGRRPAMDTTVRADLVITVGTVLWRGD
jgi:hypothetical protein